MVLASPALLAEQGDNLPFPVVMHKPGERKRTSIDRRLG